mmetsp:Transcript_20715/g.57298  ORF Transcript_20715/g.57298 Transcript_20715/m.57298 type:complete len:351 (-) Transcript_20715:151-1203(-)
MAAARHFPRHKPGHTPAHALQGAPSQGPGHAPPIVRREQEPERPRALRLAGHEALGAAVGALEAIRVAGQPARHAHEAAEAQLRGLPGVGVQGHAAALRGAAHEHAVRRTPQPGHLRADVLRQPLPGVLQSLSRAHAILALVGVEVPGVFCLAPRLPHAGGRWQHHTQARGDMSQRGWAACASALDPRQTLALPSVTRAPAAKTVQVDQGVRVGAATGRRELHIGVVGSQKGRQQLTTSQGRSQTPFPQLCSKPPALLLGPRAGAQKRRNQRHAVPRAAHHAPPRQRPGPNAHEGGPAGQCSSCHCADNTASQAWSAATPKTRQLGQLNKSHDFAPGHGPQRLKHSRLCG